MLQKSFEEKMFKKLFLIFSILFLLCSCIPQRNPQEQISSFPSTELQQAVISETTARRLLDMMNTAVLEGTGHRAQVDIYGAGGKTGSAETGWEKNGKLMQQGWFAGYFPAENPKYVCVVIAEGGNSGGDSACPVFKMIADNMCKWVFAVN